MNSFKRGYLKEDIYCILTEKLASKCHRLCSCFDDKWLAEDKFTQKYQISRESFGNIFELIQNYPIFHPATTNKETIKQTRHETSTNCASTDGCPRFGISKKLVYDVSLQGAPRL